MLWVVSGNLGLMPTIMLYSSPVGSRPCPWLISQGLHFMWLEALSLPLYVAEG